MLIVEIVLSVLFLIAGVGLGFFSAYRAGFSLGRVVLNLLGTTLGVLLACIILAYPLMILFFKEKFGSSHGDQFWTGFYILFMLPMVMLPSSMGVMFERLFGFSRPRLLSFILGIFGFILGWCVFFLMITVIKTDLKFLAVYFGPLMVGSSVLLGFVISEYLYYKRFFSLKFIYILKNQKGRFYLSKHARIIYPVWTCLKKVEVFKRRRQLFSDYEIVEVGLSEFFREMLLEFCTNNRFICLDWKGGLWSYCRIPVHRFLSITKPWRKFLVRSDEQV